MSKKVLVLDAIQRSALAATRSLGKKGLYIITADNHSATLAGASKYSKKALVYPSPQNETDAFITFIKTSISLFNIDIIYPMSEITCSVVMKHRDQFPDIIIPVADYDKFSYLSDKCALFKLAASLNLPIPDTHFIDTPENIQTILPKINFPVVLKPIRSRILSGNDWINTTVAFAHSPEELNKLIGQYVYFRDHPFMLQSYIGGVGQGLFTLYKDGKPICYFAHKRLKEKPPQGGVSVLSESVTPSAEMIRSATTLLDHVKWTGIAMVEFKVSSDGTPYLMEINARFWGSLQLAIDAGVDFPYLLYQASLGGNIDGPKDFEKGVKLRWLLGDLDRLIIVFKDSSLSIFDKLKELGHFMKFLQPGMRYETNRLDDIKPFLFELKQYVKVNIFRK